MKKVLSLMSVVLLLGTSVNAQKNTKRGVPDAPPPPSAPMVADVKAMPKPPPPPPAPPCVSEPKTEGVEAPPAPPPPCKEVLVAPPPPPPKAKARSVTV